MFRPMTLFALLFLITLTILSSIEIATGIDGLSVATGQPIYARMLTAALSALAAVGLLWELLRTPHNRSETLAEAQPPDGRRYGLPVHPTVAMTTALAPKVTLDSSSPKRASKGSLESVMIDGKLTPAAYFMFASDPISVAAIRKAKADYGRVLIGFDAGGIPETGEIENEAFSVARDLGVELEIYVEGPGGKTGDRWDPGETARVKAAAKSVGINTARGGWMARDWDTTGWKSYTFRQLGNYRRIGFNAGEIDNLDRVIKTSAALVGFFREYAERYQASELPQLVMKNISEEDMTEVVAAINSGELPRTMFSDFHIFECGNSDTWKPVDDISVKVGIRTVPSRDTHHYAAKGKFDLDDAFDAAIGREQGRAAPVA